MRKMIVGLLATLFACIVMAGNVPPFIANVNFVNGAQTDIPGSVAPGQTISLTGTVYLVSLTNAPMDLTGVTPTIAVATIDKTTRDTSTIYTNGTSALLTNGVFSVSFPLATNALSGRLQLKLTDTNNSSMYFLPSSISIMPVL